MISKRLLRLVVLLILAHIWYLVWTSGLSKAEWLRRLDFLLLDAEARLSERPGPANPKKPVVIGLSRVDVRRLGSFPWPRERWAEVIRKLNQAGARKIILDVFFIAAGESKKGDQELVSALQQAGNVLLPVYSSILLEPEYLEGGGVTVGQIQLNAPRLQAAVHTTGHINAFLDVDEKIRFVPLYLQHLDRTYYQLSLEALRDTPEARGLVSDIQVDREWPGIFIDYRGFDSRYDMYSIGELLSGVIPADRLAGRLVFVGQTTQGLPFADIVSTPLGLRHGIFLLAALGDQIQSGRQPHPLKPLESNLYLYGICLASVLLAGFLNQRLRILGLVCAPVGMFLFHVTALQNHDLVLPFTASTLALAIPMLIAFVSSDFYFRFKTRRELEQAEKLSGIGRMAGMIAHDVRNPLAILLGHVGELKRRSAHSNDHERVESISRQARRIDMMLQELLDYTSGQMKTELEAADLPRFLSDVKKHLVQDFCFGRGIELELDCPIKEGKAMIDRVRFQRAIENLVKNAVEEMPGGGTIRISLSEEHKVWCLRISDSGPGIPGSVRENPFKPFATAGKKHGFGLGLAIVLEIVQRHGGTIRIDATGAKGTTFLMTLPRPE